MTERDPQPSISVLHDSEIIAINPQFREVEPVRPLTPQYDELIAEAKRLDALSKYPCEFDYSAYRKLELRFAEKPIRGGIMKQSPMKLVNASSSCQQCLYALELDTYGRGCLHNCHYCYAKSELTKHGFWNNPLPVPINVNDMREMFYKVFETDKNSKWRPLLEKRIPIRIGCMSDSFMWLDKQLKVTQEVLKIFRFYNYPYTAVTRSDLIAEDDYIDLMPPEIASIQFSISTVNDGMSRRMEPGAPVPSKRLAALNKLNKAGYWTSARINPMFPIHPDGYYSNNDFQWQGELPKFDYSSFDMVETIAASGTRSIICGFGRFSGYALNNIQKALGVDLRIFFNKELSGQSSSIYRFSDAEIRAYYEEIKRRCQLHKLEFTVCYIGNNEDQFWSTQDLWDNKKDCCNIKERIASFKTDSRQIDFDTRLKFTSVKCSAPLDPARLHVPLGGDTPARQGASVIDRTVKTRVKRRPARPDQEPGL